LSEPFTHHTGNAGAISFRQSVVGGRLDKPGKVSPTDLLERDGRIVVLIHGFNVTQDDADLSYDNFERHLSESVRKQLVRLYWPGDSSTIADTARGRQGQITKIISPLLYMLKPKVARLSSQLLIGLLTRAFQARYKVSQDKPKPIEVCFIAHSLGCLLTLETLERLAVSQGTNIELLLTVLMAAAVPEYAVTDDGSFAKMIENIPQFWVLHSREDKTLSRWFRPGQIFEHSMFPDFRISVRRALGRKGMPSTDKIKVLEGTWDHSDYWADRDIARAVDAQLTGRRPDFQPFEPFDTLSREIRGRPVQERVCEARVARETMPLW
jgi:hypothetical protein